MPRQARIVIPDTAHHVIQRGNRRQDVFFGDEDYKNYLSLLRQACDEDGVCVQAYCLMRNHVHLIVVPSPEFGLRPLGEVHRRYTRFINIKKDWQGYLWQGRFKSYPMDEPYTYEAIRYVELNPVRAGLCAHPCEYRWSSARQRVNHDEAEGDFRAAAVRQVEDWESYWRDGLIKFDTVKQFDDNEVICRALGNVQGTMGTQ